MEVKCSQIQVCIISQLHLCDTRKDAGKEINPVTSQQSIANFSRLWGKSIHWLVLCWRYSQEGGGGGGNINGIMKKIKF
jgi:hypothetical protein